MYEALNCIRRPIVTVCLLFFHIGRYLAGAHPPTQLNSITLARWVQNAICLGHQGRFAGLLESFG